MNVGMVSGLGEISQLHNPHKQWNEVWCFWSNSDITAVYFVIKFSNVYYHLKWHWNFTELKSRRLLHLWIQEVQIGLGWCNLWGVIFFQRVIRWGCLLTFDIFNSELCRVFRLWKQKNYFNHFSNKVILVNSRKVVQV